MKTKGGNWTVALFLALGCAGLAAAQDSGSEAPQEAATSATPDDVQRETEEAVKAVQSHGAGTRQAAQAQAREAVAGMQARIDGLQEEWNRERLRLDEQARERRARMFAGARERLELAQQRSSELDAASEAEWIRARTRFIESYRVLAKDVQELVERSMPGRPVPPDAGNSSEDEAVEVDERRPKPEPHPSETSPAGNTGT